MFILSMQISGVGLESTCRQWAGAARPPVRRETCHTYKHTTRTTPYITRQEQHHKPSVNIGGRGGGEGTMQGTCGHEEKTGHTHKHTTRTTPHNTRQEQHHTRPHQEPPPSLNKSSQVARRRCVPPPKSRWVAALKSAWNAKV